MAASALASGIHWQTDDLARLPEAERTPEKIESAKIINFAVALAEKQAAEQGSQEGPIAQFTKAIALDPQNATAWFDRAVSHYHKKDFKRAIADFSEAIRLNPSDARAYKYRSVTHHAYGHQRFDQGLDDSAQLAAMAADHIKSARLSEFHAHNDTPGVRCREVINRGLRHFACSSEIRVC